GPQPTPPRSGLAQAGPLRIVTPALRADDQQNLALTGQLHIGDRVRCVAVEQQRPGSRGHQPREALDPDGLAYLGNPRPPRLLGGRLRGPPPPLQCLRTAWAIVPPGDTARCTPRHDRIGPRLGGELNGQLTAFSLD